MALLCRWFATSEALLGEASTIVTVASDHIFEPFQVDTICMSLYVCGLRLSIHTVLLNEGSKLVLYPA